MITKTYSISLIPRPSSTTSRLNTGSTVSLYKFNRTVKSSMVHCESFAPSSLRHGNPVLTHSFMSLDFVREHPRYVAQHNARTFCVMRVVPNMRPLIPTTEGADSGSGISANPFRFEDLGIINFGIVNSDVADVLSNWDSILCACARIARSPPHCSQAWIGSARSGTRMPPSQIVWRRRASGSASGAHATLRTVLVCVSRFDRSWIGCY